MELFAFLSAEELMPVMVFIAIVAGVFWLLSMISNREQPGGGAAVADRAAEVARRDRDVAGGLGAGSPASRRRLEPRRGDGQRQRGGEEHAQDQAGECRVPQRERGGVYQGIRVVCLVVFLLLPALFFFLLKDGFTMKSIQWTVILGGLGFYLPQIGLWHLRSTRQKEIFLTLPDALDLLVVCVESGLGLDAALRKVTEEMKGHAKIICEEFALANLAPDGASRARCCTTWESGPGWTTSEAWPRS